MSQLARDSAAGLRPLGLIAELTHRCPLHCPYCSNPTRLGDPRQELTTGDWRRVMAEAAELGIVHALFTGGEPLARNDLEEIIAAARAAGLYTNLITSAVGLTRERAATLAGAGLDAVQISFQSDQPALADWIAGARAHDLKLQACRVVRDSGWPLTINIVLHRLNIDRVAAIIGLAEEVGAAKLELANIQFYGWAWDNRATLLPTRQQVERAEAMAAAAQDRLRGRMQILFVLPDYFSDRPKPCMHGWGRRYIAVNPAGEALPCPTAYCIPSLRFDNVHQRSLAWIWRHSDAFNRFRGTEWMPKPCRSCALKEIDFGGCRCQAALVTGNAGSTDPACGLSSDHHLITEAAAGAPGARVELRYRGAAKAEKVAQIGVGFVLRRGD